MGFVLMAAFIPIALVVLAAVYYILKFLVMGIFVVFSMLMDKSTVLAGVVFGALVITLVVLGATGVFRPFDLVMQLVDLIEKAITALAKFVFTL